MTAIEYEKRPIKEKGLGKKHRNQRWDMSDMSSLIPPLDFFAELIATETLFRH